MFLTIFLSEIIGPHMYNRKPKSDREQKRVQPCTARQKAVPKAKMNEPFCRHEESHTCVSANQTRHETEDNDEDYHIPLKNRTKIDAQLHTAIFPET
jgi:hypothetical protein